MLQPLTGSEFTQSTKYFLPSEGLGIRFLWEQGDIRQTDDIITDYYDIIPDDAVTLEKLFAMQCWMCKMQAHAYLSWHEFRNLEF